MSRKSVIVFSLALLGIFGQAFPGIRIESKLTQEKDARQGESYQGVISIRNAGPEARAVRFYLTDYQFFSNGKNVYGEPGKSERSNAAWITFSPQSMSLSPAGVGELHYSVRVPEGGVLKGTYWSMLMAEEISTPPSEPAGSAPNKPQVGLGTVLRYGIQMVTHIGDSGNARLKFLKTELLKQPGGVVLQTDIENTGERWLRPSLYAELFDAQGKCLGKFTAGRCRVYPETSVRMKIDIGNLPKGRYRAVIIADNGDENVFGAQYTLTL